VNVVLILLPLAGTTAVALIKAANNRAIRRTAVVAAAATFGASIFAGTAPAVPGLLRAGLSPLETSLVITLCGCFFLVVVARGLAARSETICSLLLLSAFLLGIFAANRVVLVIALALLWLLVGTLLKLRGLEGRERALGSFAVAAGVSLAFGFGAVLSHRPVLLQIALVCLLGAFPAHFWLPRMLPRSPFLLATLAPVLLTRLSVAAYVRFLPVEPNDLLAAFGLIGAVWCGTASLAGENLREKLGYFVGVQASFSLWAIGKGAPDAALLLILVTTPPTVLWGLGTSILFDRLKCLEADRLQGIGVQLGRLNLLLIFAALGIALFPGTVGFPGAVFLLEQVTSATEVWCLGAAVVLLLLSSGHAYVRVAFGETSDELRRSGDLNARELAAGVPLGLCVAAGLWPGLAGALRAIFQ
jgi:NADH:ubiquinone oxidoreductase subunit 4 (subunit M)